jgi:predicted RNA-binding Zn-ribbon protein involved in translation (DUF1610 family)
MAERDLVCKVCGKEFTPRSYNKKVVKTMSGKHYDTFDCPKCGCQVIAHERIVDGQDDRLLMKKEHSEPKEQRFDATYMVKDVVFDDRSEAAKVYEWVTSVLKTYYWVTVADFYEFTNVRDSIPYFAHKYGWSSMDGMAIVRRKDGKYILHMPRAKFIEE